MKTRRTKITGPKRKSWGAALNNYKACLETDIDRERGRERENELNGDT